jgi:excisionase family DNA binding protein
MKLTLGMAAKHLGVTKPTLSKAIHSGKLAAERREDGSFAIDTAELDRYRAAHHRRFQETRKATASVSRLGTPPDPLAEADLQIMVERLELEARARLAEGRLADLKDQLEDMRAQRDGWQKQAEASQRQLLDQRPRCSIFGWLKAR